jgi:processive 1,2-diacylglycerol beta-glucosyltransferase
MTEGPSVLLVTASVGAGHDSPAHEMAARVRAAGGRATVVDLVATAPCGSLLRNVFRALLTRWPGAWGRLYEAFDADGTLPAPLRAVIRAAGRRLARTADAVAADLVIGTFPLAGRVVGAARQHTARPLPLATYVTDPAVHSLWLDEFTDLYLVTWLFAPAALRRRTSTPVAVCAPALRPMFGAETLRLDGGSDRSRLGLPAGPLALVASGSWAVGDVLGTVRDVLADGRYAPVVVCGRNDRLRRAVAAMPGAVALGWVEDMSSVMRVCDVAVLNSGGLTLAETAACRLPVVHDRPLVGQGRLNAEVCARAAGVPVLGTGTGLRRAISDARSLAGHLGEQDPVAAAFTLLRRAPFFLPEHRADLVA